MKLLVSLITLFSLHGRVFANTEKVIFVAPPAPLEPLEYHRALATLTPSNPVAHKIQVQLSFEAPTQTFFSLESLDIGRTYEVRVCWPAMIPTDFKLVVEPETNSTMLPGGQIEDRKGASKTYLILEASPAFLSHKRELMETPPPVYFDLILDPLIFGVIPESLLPIIGYACVVAVVAWFIVGKVAVGLMYWAVRAHESKGSSKIRQKIQ